MVDLVRPAPLRTDGSNAFAHHSMAVRVPSIIDETIERNDDYPPEIADALKRLRDEIAGDAPLRLFDLPAPDHDLWRGRFARHDGETWLDTEWFFAEMLSYRLVMEAARYWTTLRDPFAPFKREERTSDALWVLLDEALAVRGTIEERLARTLLLTLWGNRIDLSIASVAEKGTSASEEHLLVDHTAAAARDLVGGELDALRPDLRSGGRPLSGGGASMQRSGGDASVHRPGRGPCVHIIMDNAGSEEAMDLVLADLLLTERAASHVVLHVKMLPVLVSDVITVDVHEMLEAMTARGREPAGLARRLRTYMGDGRLRVVPDLFWNTDGRLWELPPRLYRAFGGAALVIGKGDVNYRRAAHDAVWPLETTLEEAVSRFPAPLLLLRTLKSDTLVEVPRARAAELDTAEPDWRTNGTYGVVQYAFGESVMG